MIESMLVGMIVAAAASYAAWSLMPQAWRRALERRVGWPRSTRGCAGCAGCAPGNAERRPVKIVRKP